MLPCCVRQSLMLKFKFKITEYDENADNKKNIPFLKRHFHGERKCIKVLEKCWRKIKIDFLEIPDAMSPLH